MVIRAVLTTKWYNTWRDEWSDKWHVICSETVLLYETPKWHVILLLMDTLIHMQGIKISVALHIMCQIEWLIFSVDGMPHVNSGDSSYNPYLFSLFRPYALPFSRTYLSHMMFTWKRPVMSSLHSKVEPVMSDMVTASLLVVSDVCSRARHDLKAWSWGCWWCGGALGADVSISKLKTYPTV